MKSLIVVLSILMLSGCVAVNGNLSFDTKQVPQSVVENTEKVFVGVPVLLGMEGSTARLDGDWLVTAAHNRVILELTGKDVYYHPKCDIALVKSKGDNIVPIGLLHNEVYTVGYPVSPSPLSVNKGEWVQDVISDECLYSQVSATLISGMSGGGAYNEKGELVGVNVMIGSFTDEKGVDYNSVSFIITLVAAHDWIEEVTGKDFYLNY